MLNEVTRLCKGDFSGINYESDVVRTSGFGSTGK